MAEQVQLDIDLAEVRRELIALRAELNRTSADAVRDFNQIGAAAKKAGKETEDAFNVGSALGVSDALDELQREYDELRRASERLKQSLRSATDPTAIKLYAQSVAQLELGMRRLETAGSKAGVNLKKAAGEAGTGRQVFEGLFGAFTKVTLILAAIDAVRKFVSAAVSLSEETAKAEKAFTSFLGSAEKAKEVVADLTGFAGRKLLNTEDVLQAGKGLLAFGENADNLVPVLGRIADISAATGKNFNELATIYGKAKTAGVLYAEDINQLVDAGIPIIQEFAKQLGVSTDQVKKLASEGKISFEELQLAFFNLTAEGGKFAGQAEAQAETLTGVWQGLFNEVRPAIAAIGEFFSDIAKGIGFILTDLVKGVKSLFGADETVKIDVDYTGRDAYEQAKDDLYERERLEKEAAKRRAELNKKNSAEAARLEKEIAQLRVNALKDGQEKEIAQENLRFKELRAQLRKYHLDTSQAEEQHKINLAKIRVKYELERIAKEAADREAEKESIQNGLDEIAAIVAADEKRKADAAAKLLGVRKSAAELEAAQFEAGLLAAREVFFQKKRTDQEIEEYERNVAKARELFQLEQQRAELQSLLQFGANLTDAEKAILETRVRNIGTQIDQLQKGIGERKADKPFSIFSLFGLDPERDREQVEAIKSAFSEIIDGLEQLTAARVEAAEVAVESADRQVSAAEDALDREIELAQLGFASNVDLKKQELEEAKKAREKALEEQKKAQKQQLVVDSIQQASNIAVSSTNLIKSWSTLPFGIGLVLAFAQVAQIVAFMSNIRAKAKAISNQQFRHGGEARLSQDGFIVGPSHERGGVKPELEGGEFLYSDGRKMAVVKRTATRTHFDLLRAVNADNRPAMAAYLERLTGGTQRNTDSTDAAAAGGGTVRVLSTTDGAGRRLMEKNNRLVEENNRLTKRLLDLEERRETWQDMGEYILHTKGGKTERIKKRG